MSIASQLSALASRIGNEIKGLIRPDHPGLARAWVNFGYANGSVQVRAAHNVASVTRLATGRYRIAFETAMPDTGYCWVATGRSNTNSGTVRFAAARGTADNKVEAGLEIVCTSSSGSLADSLEVSLVVFR
jgi:hypothetical protein